MTEERRIAFHEAAHVVVGLEMGLGASVAGIDLKYTNAATGAQGGAAMSVYEIDDLRSLSGAALETAQEAARHHLMANLLVVAAGAAADAKLLGTDPWIAYQEQSSDLARAKEFLDRMAFEDGEALTPAYLRQSVEQAADCLADVRIWKAVETVATEVLCRGGRLDGPAIEAIAKPALAAGS
jgi:hypothetical protein